jgi:hypothetical protein
MPQGTVLIDFGQATQAHETQSMIILSSFLSALAL